MTKRISLLSMIALICLAICSVFVFSGCTNAKETVDNVIDSVVYTISFDADTGTGEMNDETTLGTFTLPKNEFTAPAGKEFKCWLVGTTEKEVGAKITVEADTSIKAVWKNITPVTATLLKVSCTNPLVEVGDVFDLDTLTIECTYSNGTKETVDIDDVQFFIGDEDITEDIDQVIPAEGAFIVTVKYEGLTADFGIVSYKEYGKVFEMTQGDEHTGLIIINFDYMRTEEDLYSIFSPSIENVGIRMDDDGLRLARDEYGNVIGAEITGTGAWFRFRQPNFKDCIYTINLVVDTSNMQDGEVVRFHADEAVTWGGDFATIEKSDDLQFVNYVFETNDQDKIVIKVYVNDVLVNTVVTNATVENFLEGNANACEGVCWCVYDFGAGNDHYSGGAIITSMFLTEQEIGE